MVDGAPTASTDRPASWSQFPAPAGIDRGGTFRAALVVVVAAAPVAGAAGGAGVPVGRVALAAAVAGVMASWWDRRSRRPLPVIGVALVAAVIVGLAGGRPSAWSLLLALVALGAASGLTEAQRARGTEPLEPVAGLALLAGWWGWRHGSPMSTLVLQAVAVAVALVGHLPGAPLERVARWLHVAVSAAVLAIGRVLFALLGVFMVLLPWAIGRCVAWDPTWSRRPTGSRLVPLARSPFEVGRQWRARPDQLPIGVRRRLHAVALVVPVVVVALVAAVAAWAASAPPPEGSDSPALASSSWWPDARRAQLATFDDATLQGFEGPVLADVRSEHTNVVDGRRRTFTPEDPELTVWFLGGSAAFGLGQRDDHTIASELARAGAADGVAIRVENFGVHGDVLWMELNRLRAALARGAEPPDLVVFYDGFNELATFDYLRSTGRWSDQPFVGSEDSTGIQRVPSGLGRWLPGGWFSGAGAPSVASGEVPPGDDEVLAAAVAQYRESVAVTSAVLDKLGIPAVFVYQPSRVTRSEPVPGEDDDGAAQRAAERTFRSSLPAVVLDLSAALDPVREPVYWDAVHTNELGARVVAGELWQRIAPQLRELQAGGR